MSRSWRAPQEAQIFDEAKNLSATMLALLVVTNLASAFATSIGPMLMARGIVGLCMGGIWAIAGGLAPRLVQERSIGAATAIIFGGVAAASVLGVPIGAMIGDFEGWRWAFGAISAFSAAVLALNLAVLPPLPVRHSVALGQFTALLAQRPVGLWLIITLLLGAGISWPIPTTAALAEVAMKRAPAHANAATLR